MMNDDLSCRDVVELLTEYLEGALNDDTAQTVRNHLDACEGCDRYLEQLQLTISSLGEIGREQPAQLSPEAIASLTDAFRATFRTGGEHSSGDLER
jgi:anti-sigma factor RsiW